MGEVSSGIKAFKRGIREEDELDRVDVDTPSTPSEIR
jgi:hypothetical protein